jgi:hypothetical protein
MSTNINGFQVLGAIAKNADVFEGISADATKAAKTLILKLMKAKSTNLARLREICSALGFASFGLIADELTGTHITTLLTRLDRYRASNDTETVLQRRQHFYALANSTVEPAPKPASANKAASKVASPKKTAKSKSKARVNIDYESAEAVADPAPRKTRRPR